MIKNFLHFTEITTKITSVFAFLMVIAYLVYVKQPINWALTGLFFLSMFVFDLTTTAINNYIDTKTNSQQLQFSRRAALAMIYIMFAVSAGAGILLAVKTDVVVLLLGGLCFLCGVCYTYGPVPISRLPLGEVFSGVFYGFFIPLILLYINMPQGHYFSFGLQAGELTVRLKLLPLITLALLSVAPMCTTANIMLANNICDVPEDIKVKRYTLPYYLGRHSLGLFVLIYVAVYAAAVVMVVAGILPYPYLLLFLSGIPVWKNTRAFLKKQEKATTFLYAVKNYIIIMSTAVAALLLCVLTRL